MAILTQLKNSYKLHIEIIVLSTLLLAISYLIGYWSTFEVNIFPFLTLSDLIKFSAYPLLWVFPIVLLSQIFVNYFVYPSLTKDHTSPSKAKNFIARIFHKDKNLILRMLCIATILVTFIKGIMLNIYASPFRE
jgi:uncharacterized membrane protein